LGSGVNWICGNPYAFAAVKEGGSVVTWGHQSCGGDHSCVAPLLQTGVRQVGGTERAFAALTNDGLVFAWGRDVNSEVIPDRRIADGVIRMYSNASSVVVIRADGTISGTSICLTLNVLAIPLEVCFEPVSMVASSSFAFVAVSLRGRVFAWGGRSYGADSSAVASRISEGVMYVFGTSGAFAALKQDGSVVTWGDAERGGDSSDVFSLLSSGVTWVVPNSEAFAAIKEDGRVVTWGCPESGGDSSSVGVSLMKGVREVHGGGR
jgi:alpha-tubulin suppressor-like RCC1 family protein